MRLKCNDYIWLLWWAGAAFISPRLNVGLYLKAWKRPRLLDLPGSTYCLRGTLNYEAGPLRVVWVR